MAKKQFSSLNNEYELSLDNSTEVTPVCSDILFLHRILI